MLWPEMQIIANRERGEVKTVSIDYEANVSNADTRTKTKITSQNQNITNKSSDAINPSNPGIIESEGNSKPVNLPTLPLPMTENNATVNKSLSSSGPSSIELSSVSSIKATNIVKLSRKKANSNTAQNSNKSEVLQHADVTSCPVLPNAPLPLDAISSEMTNASSSVSSGRASISPTPLSSVPAGADEQAAVDGASSRLSFSSVINISSSVAPSSPASCKTTTSSMRPTSHPSATFSISSRSPSPAYSNPNSVTSSQDAILSEPGCGSGRPSVDSPAISATYSDAGAHSEGIDVSDGISQTSSVDQELKDELAPATKSESNLVTGGTTVLSSTSLMTDARMAGGLGLKVPVSEIDPSILPKTFTKSKNSFAVATCSRGGSNNSPSTTLINKMRAPRGTVNLERSQEICRTAVEKSPNWVQVDPSVVRTTLQQVGPAQNVSKITPTVTTSSVTASTSLANIIVGPNVGSSITSVGGISGAGIRPTLGNIIPITVRPSISNATGTVQIMAMPPAKVINNLTPFAQCYQV